jgi:hypothetical protein
MSTAYTDYESAPVASMRMTLADGRVFTFSASDDGAGKISFSALDGTARMTSDEFATVVAVEHIDALGRVAQCMRRAGEPLQG